MPRKKEVVSGNFVKYDAVVLGSGPLLVKARQ